jgi:SpoVK/Ycf46/Vps4 family AAA+-type ATPase
MLMLDRRGNRPVPEVGSIVETTEADSFDNLILHPDTLTSVRLGVLALNHREDLDRVFGISKIQPMAGKSAINLHGAPGTGKTRTARVIARLIGKPLYAVDYSAMISKYVGDTAKHISAAFAKAAEYGAVLYWDEADSLCSRRIDADEATGTSINQNRNVLMQEMDKYEGVVLFSTNFVKNFDPAILRRIARNVEFKLPLLEQRTLIYKLHFPVMDRVFVESFDKIAKASEGFSGGDILTVALNSIYSAILTGAPEAWGVSEAAVLKEVVTLHRTKLAAATNAEITKGDLRGRVSRAEMILAQVTGSAVSDEAGDDLDLNLGLGPGQ